MTSILLSCYRCDPEGVSEAYSGYKWAEVLGARYRVHLCTPAFTAPRVVSALAASGIRGVTVVPIEMPDIDSRLGAFGSAVKPGFFMYEQRMLRRVAAEGLPSKVDLVWHRTPMSFRNRTRLHRLGRPLVIGPVGGGLKNPPELDSYFRGDGRLGVLKQVDDLMLSSSWWMRPFDVASAIIATCDYVRDVFPARLSEKTTTVLDVGVDSAPEPSFSEHQAFTVLFVGRLVRYKAPSLAIDAFSRFLREGGSRGARLVVVGDGPEMPRLRSMVDDAKLSDVVEFTGGIPKSAVLERYRQADVFLFPSLTEASGNVYLEAMNAGLPLIVVDNGGGRYIPDSRSSIQVALGDEQSIIEGLSDALARLAEDPDLRRTMGRAAHQRVTTEFTWHAIGDKAAGVIEQVLSEVRLDPLKG